MSLTDDLYRVTTPRLCLRELTPNDLDFYAAMTGDPEVMRYYPKLLDRKEAKLSLEKQFERYRNFGYGLWLVEDRVSGSPVGRVGIIRQTIDDVLHLEVGYMIHRPHWRQGFATEAATACHAYVFEKLNADHVVALVRPENTPSQRTARNLGMQVWRRTMHFGLLHDVYRIERAVTSLS